MKFNLKILALNPQIKNVELQYKKTSFNTEIKKIQTKIKPTFRPHIKNVEIQFKKSQLLALKLRNMNSKLKSWTFKPQIKKGELQLKKA